MCEFGETCQIKGPYGPLIQPVQLFYDQSLLKKGDFSFKMHAWTWEIQVPPSVFFSSQTPKNKIKFSCDDFFFEISTL